MEELGGEVPGRELEDVVNKLDDTTVAVDDPGTELED